MSLPVPRTFAAAAVTAAMGMALVLGFTPGAAATEGARLSGGTRFATAVAISKTLVPDPAGGVANVYVASGQDFPDALAAGAAASATRTPVLAVRRDSIPAEVGAELVRLNPSRVTILGGTGAITAAVEAELATMTGAPTTRLAGADRYETAALLSASAFTPDPTVAYLASGKNYPDALAGAAAAGFQGGPVLLTAPDYLPEATQAELARLHPGRIVILGGGAAVGNGVEEQAGAYATTTRLAGPNRYGTAVEIARATFGQADTVLVASGQAFPDALATAPLAAAWGAPVLLVPRDHADADVCAELNRLAPTRIITVGGTAAISESNAQRIASRCQLPAGPEFADGGVRSPVPQAGSGNLVVVPGRFDPPDPSRHGHVVLVRVEENIGIDPVVFADLALAILNDQRGWGPGDQVSFGRTDDPAAASITITLASPATTQRLCAAYPTNGYTSCATGRQAVINAARWAYNARAFVAAGGPIEIYRIYLINHEVGHLLHHGHVGCPGAGRLAPIMLQQTLRLDGCRPNGWPNP